MQKRYWLRGFLSSLIAYAVAIILVYVTSIYDEWGPAFPAMTAGVFLSPVIVIGLLAGWLYGKIKTRSTPHS